MHRMEHEVIFLSEFTRYESEFSYSKALCQTKAKKNSLSY